MTSIVSLSQFAVIKLSGEQSHSFLQGQVTCNVDDIKASEWQAGAHCNAKGKAWSTFIAFEQNDALYLVMTKESAEVSLAELNKYGVFSKTDITDDTNNWHIYGSNEAVASQKSIELTQGHVLVLSREELTVTADSSNEWWNNEVLSGRAHLFAKTIGEYVPQMINLQALNYISFNKGCYMGQEMVARMRYLGKNKRALYLAETDGEYDLTAGDDVFKAMNNNRRASGKVINSTTYNGKTTAQLVLPNDTDLNDKIYLDSESDQHFRLLPLPYSLDQD